MNMREERMNKRNLRTLECQIDKFFMANSRACNNDTGWLEEGLAKLLQSCGGEGIQLVC